jgi:glycosyltransferase involved in cell wall biosynthesis
MPRVSVVLPVRDGMPFLREAVESLQAQTYGDFEVLISDDHSTDDTAAYLATLRDQRIRVIRPASPVGLVEAHRFAVAATSSELVAITGQDDIAEPDRLAKQVALLDEDPTLSLVGCWCSMIDRGGKQVGMLRYAVTAAEIRAQIVRNTHVPLPAMLFRRAAYDAIGGFTEDCDYAFDYDLVARFARRLAVANVPEELVRVRYNPNGASVTGTRRVQRGALRVRWRELRAGGHSVNEYLWLLKPVVGLLMPARVMRRIIVQYMRTVHAGDR